MTASDGRTGTCCVSVDLDALACYHQIHGLPPPLGVGEDPVFTRAVPRLLDLFARAGITATFFVVGRDLEQPGHAALVREIVAAGHEVANHSYSHDYRLTARSMRDLRPDITRAHDLLSEVCGRAITGFRAPGYNVDRRVFRVLRDLDYRYDSSVFPCPPYYAAKAAVIARLKLTGSPSRSMLGSAQALVAPLEPYRCSGDPFTVDPGGTLWEVPIAVLPVTRLPFIGTSLILAGPTLAGLMSRWIASSRRLVSLELHGVDLLDPISDPVAPELVERQPDLRVGLGTKLKVLDAVFGRLGRTHRFESIEAAIGC